MIPLRIASIAFVMLLLPVGCNDSGGNGTPPATTGAGAPDDAQAKTPPPVVAPDNPMKLPDPPRPGELEQALQAVIDFQALIEAKDYDTLYAKHLHSAAHKKTSKDRFVRTFEDEMGVRMGLLLEAILQAQDAGGIQSGALVFKRYPDGKVPEAIALEVPSRRGDRDWAYRLIMAPDGDELKFYDVD
jgi:hypothetical protein